MESDASAVGEQFSRNWGSTRTQPSIVCDMIPFAFQCAFKSATEGGMSESAATTIACEIVNCIVNNINNSRTTKRVWKRLQDDGIVSGGVYDEDSCDEAFGIVKGVVIDSHNCIFSSLEVKINCTVHEENYRSKMVKHELRNYYRGVSERVVDLEKRLQTVNDDDNVLKHRIFSLKQEVKWFENLKAMQNKKQSTLLSLQKTLDDKNDSHECSVECTHPSTVQTQEDIDQSHEKLDNEQWKHLEELKLETNEFSKEQMLALKRLEELKQRINKHLT
jgi:hypothetical protein